MSTRRRYHRFPGEDGAYAVLTRYGSLPIAGKINDISFGGVGISYLALKPGEGKFSIKLLGPPDSIAPVERLKCRIVYNSPVPGEAWGDLVTWRSGIKFEAMTQNSQAGLEQFISDLLKSRTGYALRQTVTCNRRYRSLSAYIAFLRQRFVGMHFFQEIAGLFGLPLVPVRMNIPAVTRRRSLSTESDPPHRPAWDNSRLLTTAYV